LSTIEALRFFFGYCLSLVCFSFRSYSFRSAVILSELHKLQYAID